MLFRGMKSIILLSVIVTIFLSCSGVKGSDLIFEAYPKDTLGNILLIAGGSRGDTQPVVALGKGLKEKGYHVHLLAGIENEPFARANNFQFTALMSVKQLIQEDEEGIKCINSGQFDCIVEWNEKIKEKIEEEDTKIIKDTISHYQSDLDLLIGTSTSTVPLYCLSKMYDVPYIQPLLQPWPPTDEYTNGMLPAEMFVNATKEETFNSHLLHWQMSEELLVQHSSALCSSVYSPEDNSEKYNDCLFNMDTVQKLMDNELENGLILHAFPPEVISASGKIPHDWKTPAETVVGYLVLETTEEEQENELMSIDPELVAFLESGEPPVYMGFGSMPSEDPKRLTSLVVNTFMLANVRGIMYKGWANLDLDLLDPYDQAAQVEYAKKNIFYIEHGVSHEWLFPRCAAAIIHGGAGTTASCFRAGIPCLVSPVNFDQPYFGKRVQDLGIGYLLSYAPKLTPQEASEKLISVLNSDTIVDRAADLAAKIRQHNGVDNSIVLMEKFIQENREKKQGKPHHDEL